MPVPGAEQFSPEFWELIKHVERSLHHIARTVQTREQAIIVKRDLLAPIGVMNSRFGLPSTTVPWRNGLTRRREKE